MQWESSSRLLTRYIYILTHFSFLLSGVHRLSVELEERSRVIQLQEGRSTASVYLCIRVICISPKNNNKGEKKIVKKIFSSSAQPPNSALVSSSSLVHYAFDFSPLCNSEAQSLGPAAAEAPATPKLHSPLFFRYYIASFIFLLISISLSHDSLLVNSLCECLQFVTTRNIEPRKPNRNPFDLIPCLLYSFWWLAILAFDPNRSRLCAHS